eukprot:m.47048 g.47048  ORF g.47048 m.47048 type:complete len:467 (-) comp15195_c0_seq2:2318-3718(-)
MASLPTAVSDTGTVLDRNCAALWCNRRDSKKVRVPSLVAPGKTCGRYKTPVGIATKREAKARRNAILKKLQRQDIVEREKGILENINAVKEYRYCKDHVRTYKNGKPVFWQLHEDPVLNRSLPGLRNAEKITSPTAGLKGSAVGRALERSQDIPKYSNSRQERRSIKRIKLEAKNRFCNDGKRTGSCWEENMLAEFAERERNLSRLQRQVTELERTVAGMEEQICGLCYESLTLGKLSGSCRHFCGLPKNGMKSLIEGMEACHMDQMWNDEAKTIPHAPELGFRNSVTLAVVKCHTAFSDTKLVWAFGIVSPQNPSDSTALRRYVGKIFTTTVMIVNLFLEHTVARPPNIDKIKNLPAFDHPDLKDVMLTADATNIRLQKPHNPVGDMLTYSDYYGDNCGKIEIVSTNDGLPAFVTPTYCGRATERHMLETADFSSFYESFAEKCIDEEGNAWRPAIMADKGTKKN